MNRVLISNCQKQAFSLFCPHLLQQAVEDLLEDEDEDFDKDDKVIMSRVRVVVTSAHTRTPA